MKPFFAYTRVSSERHGENGASLQQQVSASRGLHSQSSLRNPERPLRKIEARFIPLPAPFGCMNNEGGHESIVLHTRSGRRSADILAVVAADYIRNLREGR